MSIIIYIIIGIAYFFAFYKLFPKAGRSTTEALIPGLNIWVWLKIIHKPWWWILLLIFPGINILMLMIMSVNLGTVFGKRTQQDVWLNALAPFITLPLLGMNEKTKYLGPIDRVKFKKTSAQEWRDAILFAVVAASLIRTYFMEAFMIPTSSMEKSLLVGDYLFVSKMAYGPKVPQTPLSFPFAHHTLPILNTPSFLEWMNLPYLRLPGFGFVERNDVVVFNFPAGDTVVVDEQERGYDQIVRDQAARFMVSDRQNGKKEKERSQYLKMGRDYVLKNREVTVRPVDKRENYIKRCIAIPGDKLEVKNGKLFINDSLAHIPEKLQYNFYITTTDYLNKNVLKNQFDVSFADQRKMPNQRAYVMPLTLEANKQLKENPVVISTIPTINTNTDGFPNYPIFPNDPIYNWTEDNFGPLVMPKKGETIELNLFNLPLYKRIIQVYERNKLHTQGNEIFINDTKVDSYTFQMNYYFMMGDNRHNSADSRFWGFVPEDHIVGTGSFTWLSLDQDRDWLEGKIRWNRIFRGIR